MRCRALAALASLSLLLASPVTADEKAKAKPKKPGLELRAAPRMGFSPLLVLFTAELKGGEDVEEYYCPELEWEWNDGRKSTTESDCAPFEEGLTKIERHFSAEHEFKLAGTYVVAVTLLKAGRSFAKTTVQVSVRPGLGDTSEEMD